MHSPPYRPGFRAGRIPLQQRRDHLSNEQAMTCDCDMEPVLALQHGSANVGKNDFFDCLYSAT